MSRTRKPESRIKRPNPLLVRIVCTGAVFSLLFCAVAAKAVHVMIFQGDFLRKRAENQYERELSTVGRRGAIYDANHQELAVTVSATSVAAHPVRIETPEQAARGLAGALGLSRKTLARRLSGDRSFVWIKRQITPKELAAVRALGLKGVSFLPEYSRFYPNKSLAAQVVGFSGVDGRGLEGLEFYYNQCLEGDTVTYRVLTDALGRGFSESGPAEAKDGGNIVLTIDRTIQFITENALADAVMRHKGESGMAVVMNTRTGAVMALAHFPLFNPNSFSEYDQRMWRNRAVTDPFEPGSTMKIFTAAAALEGGFCTEKTIFFCENGSYHIGKDEVNDTHPHEWLSLAQIVKLSSNIGAVKVTEMMGRRTLYESLRTFGFGEKTGTDCPGESAGTLTRYDQWSAIDAGAISFGQGISVTALQLTSAVSAIANGGLLMRPYFVQAVTDANGALIKKFPPRRVRRVISDRTADTVRRMMKSVVTEEGTGGKAAVDGYSVAGKTGTAQKVGPDGRYARGKFTSSFVGFAPADDPVITVLVVVDEPKKEHYGGSVAAPAFAEIMAKTLGYLDIPPETTRDRMTVMAGGRSAG